MWCAVTGVHDWDQVGTWQWFCALDPDTVFAGVASLVTQQQSVWGLFTVHTVDTPAKASVNTVITVKLTAKNTTGFHNL